MREAATLGREEKLFYHFVCFVVPSPIKVNSASEMSMFLLPVKIPECFYSLPYFICLLS